MSVVMDTVTPIGPGRVPASRRRAVGGSVLVWTSETPPPPLRQPLSAPDTVWVLCPVCRYEREAGLECGLPCV